MVVVVGVAVEVEVEVEVGGTGMGRGWKVPCWLVAVVIVDNVSADAGGFGVGVACSSDEGREEEGEDGAEEGTKMAICARGTNAHACTSKPLPSRHERHAHVPARYRRPGRCHHAAEEALATADGLVLW